MAAEPNGNGAKKFNQDDRVRRVDGSGTLGIVTSIRSDATGTPGDRAEKGVIVGVQWDSGTFSYFTPDALEVAK